MKKIIEDLEKMRSNVLYDIGQGFFDHEPAEVIEAKLLLVNLNDAIANLYVYDNCNNKVLKNNTL
jgi:hypothetical protein